LRPRPNRKYPSVVICNGSPAKLILCSGSICPSNKAPCCQLPCQLMTESERALEDSNKASNACRLMQVKKRLRNNPVTDVTHRPHSPASPGEDLLQTGLFNINIGFQRLYSTTVARGTHDDKSIKTNAKSLTRGSMNIAIALDAGALAPEL
jgi:hypothetical protein